MGYKSKKLIRKLYKTNVNKRNDKEFDKRCHFCHCKSEDIFHLLCSCERLSANMYLTMKHDEVGKVIYNAIIKHHFPKLHNMLFLDLHGPTITLEYSGIHM